MAASRNTARTDSWAALSDALASEQKCGIEQASDPSSFSDPFLETATPSSKAKGSSTCKLVLPILIPQVPAYGVNAMLLPILPTYVMEHFGLNAATAGLATSCLSLAPVLLGMPQNIVADKTGPHVLGIFSAVCLISSGIIGGLADVSDSFAALLVARICNGCGQSTWQMSRVLLMARAPSSERAGTLAAVGAMQRLSGLTGPFLGTLVASYFSMLGVFAAQILLGFIVLPSALLPVLMPSSALIPDYVRGSGVGAADQQTSISGMIRCAVRNRADFATAGLSCLMLGVLRQAKDFLIVLKIARLGGTVADKGLAVTMTYVFDFSFSPVSAFLMSKLGRKFSLGPALLVISLACGLLSTSASDSIFATEVIACLAGAGNGISSGLGMTFGSDIAVRREKEGRTVSKAEFLGPWREMQDLGMLLGPMIAGAVITAVSFGAAAQFCFWGGLAAAAFMVAFVEEPLRASV